MQKNAALAGLLNLVPGLGYIYARQRRLFGTLLLSLLPLFVIGAILDPVWIENTPDFRTIDWIGMLVYASAFVVDAYLLVDEKNNETA